MRLRLAVGALCAVVAIGSTVAAAPGARPPVETVTVRLTERGVLLSRSKVEVGLVRFRVTNLAREPRRFAIGGHQTRFLKRGGRQTLSVRFTREGPYTYSLVAKQGRIQKGTLDVRDAPPPTPPLTMTRIGEFGISTDIEGVPGERDALVVVQQTGLVHLLVNGERHEQPLLDLRDQVLAEGEGGLLSVAFAPDFSHSGLVYAYFTDLSGNLNLAEFRRDEEDPERIVPERTRTLLYQVKFAPNHNGGMLQFGPDGHLYLSVGDGGVAPTVGPGALVQDPTTVWGKILRFDLATGLHEAWAGGFRNPWRFWIDPVSGHMFIADVGEDRREEIDFIPRGASGLTFGWPCAEGTLEFDGSAACPGAAAPIYEYPHGPTACSVTGGVVVRDNRLPQLEGAFFFGDLCAPALSALRKTSARVTVETLAGARISQPTAFGTDNSGRVYVASGSGAVYRIDPAPKAHGAANG